jgi:hypothetical protein
MAENKPLLSVAREKKFDVFVLLLRRLVDVSLELERAWPSGDDFELTVKGYPDYLPSFDQLPHDLMAWRDAVVHARALRATTTCPRCGDDLDVGLELCQSCAAEQVRL